MVKIQSVLFNWIEEEDAVPKQCELTTKSVRKKGNQEKLRENQRGLFMGNVISKVYVSSIYKFTKVVAFCLKVAQKMKTSKKVTWIFFKISKEKTIYVVFVF